MAPELGTQKLFWKGNLGGAVLWGVLAITC